MRKLGIAVAIGAIVASGAILTVPSSAQAAAKTPPRVPGMACVRAGKTVTTAKYGRLRCARLDGRKIWRYPQLNGTKTLRVGGMTRSYVLHVPAVMNPNVPLVISLHGDPSNPAEQQAITGYNATSNANGFIVAYPAGTHEGSWADGRGTTDADKYGVNDVQFMRALIASLKSKYGVNSHRVYVSGYSNGAYMAERLACQIPGKIAAITAVSGTLPTDLPCAPARAISVLQIHGTADPFVPYNGGMVSDTNGSSPVVGTPTMVERWRSMNGCPAPSTSSLPDNGDGTSVSISSAVGCRAGSAVVFYTVNNGGHTWPGGTGGPPFEQPSSFGKTTTAFSASDTSWAFFNSHVR